MEHQQEGHKRVPTFLGISDALSLITEGDVGTLIRQPDRFLAMSVQEKPAFSSDTDTYFPTDIRMVR